MDHPIFGAINTYKASSFTIFMAKLFGQKVTQIDEQGNHVTMHIYRGKMYLTSFHVKPEC